MQLLTDLKAGVRERLKCPQWKVARGLDARTLRAKTAISRVGFRAQEEPCRSDAEVLRIDDEKSLTRVENDHAVTVAIAKNSQPI